MPQTEVVQLEKKIAAAPEKRARTIDEDDERPRKWFANFDREGRSGTIGLVPEPWKERYPDHPPTWDAIKGSSEVRAVLHYEKYLKWVSP